MKEEKLDLTIDELKVKNELLEIRVAQLTERNNKLESELEKYRTEKAE